MPKKKPSKWLVLNQIDKDLGLKRIFVEKEKVQEVNRVLIDNAGYTNITFLDRNDRYCSASILEEPSFIFRMIGFY
tara:strand:- start:232 stop:459 length:228 start_codon:yes stop_codon:yes gene_type:complete